MGSGAVSSETEDSGEDDVFDLPVEQIKKDRKPRQSVSAEAFGNWNKKEEFKAPFYPKSDDVLAKLKSRLS